MQILYENKSLKFMLTLLSWKGMYIVSLFSYGFLRLIRSRFNGENLIVKLLFSIIASFLTNV